ncbi:MAG: 50S ribosomal protein L10 [Desulfobulbaceae bacterium]|nr:50S ribosomal protein L10 [Desulfobulbaceae bacterium]
MKREEKASIVDELNGKFSKAKIAIVADYRGMPVSALEGLRRELRKSNSEIKVAKNTLLRRAVKGTSFEPMGEFFKGSTVVAISYDDLVAPAKALTGFLKDHPNFEIRSASMDGRVLSTQDLIALSTLPSREVMLSRLLSVMNAVPTSFVRVLNGVPTKMVYLLNALAEKKAQA